MADDSNGRLTNKLWGIRYAHAMPPARQPRRPDAAISKRWTERWAPWVARHVRLTGESAISFQEIHVVRVHKLLNTGLPWKTILRSDLDSPFDSETCFNNKMYFAVRDWKRRAERIRNQPKNPRESRRVNDHT